MTQITLIYSGSRMTPRRRIQPACVRHQANGHLEFPIKSECLETDLAALFLSGSSVSSVGRFFYSESDSNFPSVGLCFSFPTRFRLSSRCTGGGGPRAVRDMALTALVAVNFLFFFFFFGTTQFNHRGHRGAQRIPAIR